MRGAFVEGCTYGVASSLIYLSETLLLYVGAVLIANGTYTYLIVFSVTIGSQIMAFSESYMHSTCCPILLPFPPAVRPLSTSQ